VEDLEIMKSLEAPDCLDEYLPYDLFFEEVASLLVLANLLKDVAIIRVFHYNTALLCVRL
jgi:hypothetical protein